MSDTDKLETLNAESKIIYNYFVTNEYANKALNLLLEYLNTEYDFDDAIKQLAKEISEVVDGFTYEIVNEFDPLVSALMTASINKIDYLTIAEMLIGDYLERVWASQEKVHAKENKRNELEKDQKILDKLTGLGYNKSIKNGIGG